jgi:lambda family phage portal protein
MFNAENTNDRGVAFAGLEPGTMQFLDPGEDVKFSSPADVGGTYEAFIKQQLRATAVGLGISYEMLTGDLSSVNYSSIRAGLVEFRRKCGMLQHNLIAFQLCRPVWNRWLELAILSNAIKIPNDPSFSLVKWIPPGFAWVDPQKEINSQLNAVKAGFKSRTEVISEFGYDIEEIDDEIQKERQREKDMHLIFSSNPQNETNLKKGNR